MKAICKKCKFVRHTFTCKHETVTTINEPFDDYVTGKKYKKSMKYGWCGNLNYNGECPLFEENFVEKIKNLIKKYL